MRILNTEVYGLNESLIRSGYPMSTYIKNMDHYKEEPSSDAYDYGEIYWGNTQDLLAFNRGIKLGTTPTGTGHDKFLRGIIVQFDMIAPRYFWQEWDTYHYAESISSQSTMHCITKFDVESMCNDYVDQCVIDNLNMRIKQYNADKSTENLLRVKSNTPEGFELGRGISTNYAQLKTMYQQRKNHRLPEWSDVVCLWMLGLPYFKELCLKEVF